MPRNPPSPRKLWDSKLYTADELAFLRSRLPLYLKTCPRSRERASFITETAELFLQDFGPCKSTGLPRRLKDLKEDIRRWCINASRYRVPLLEGEDPSNSDQTLKDERPTGNKDLNVLAALFGAELGYETVSAFRVFVDHNLERIAGLVSQEMAGLEPGERKRNAAGITRRVQSREFAKLSPCELENYQSEATAETERNRRSAEAPASPEVVLRNQLRLDDVLHNVCSALLEDGPLSVGKGAFHIQYSLVGQSGPFSRTLSISSLDKHYSQSTIYKLNRIEETWAQWSLDNLTNELVSNDLSVRSPFINSELGPMTLRDILEQSGSEKCPIDRANIPVLNSVSVLDTRCKVEDFEAGVNFPQPWPPLLLPNTDRVEAAIESLPIPAETVVDIAVRAVHLGEQQKNAIAGLASNKAGAHMVHQQLQRDGQRARRPSLTSETSRFGSPSSESAERDFFGMDDSAMQTGYSFSLAGSGSASMTKGTPESPAPVEEIHDDALPRNKRGRKPKPKATQRVRGAANRKRASNAILDQTTANTARSKRTVKATERGEYFKEETLRKNARRVQRQSKL